MKLFNGNIEEQVLEILIKNPKLSTDELISAIRKRRGTVTKQGVYRVLRKLKSEEKIIIYKSDIAVNIFWIEKLQGFINQKNRSSIVGNISDLKEGEKISLTIKSLTMSDELWSNILNPLHQNIDSRHALFLYNKHNWFIFLRPETEEVQVSMIQKRRPAFLSIGGTTPLDKLSIKLAQGIGITCSHTTGFKTGDCISVLGNIILTLNLSKNTERSIDKLFKQSSNATDLATGLTKLDRKSLIRLHIQYNRKKARDLKKRISKDFFIPKEYRNF